MLMRRCVGCGKLIPDIPNHRRCPDCERQAEERRLKTRKRSDKNYNSAHSRTLDDVDRFYRSQPWRKLSATLLNTRLYCECCGHPATLVHHIRPLRDASGKPSEEAWSYRLDPTNLVCLCDSCHWDAHHKKGFDVNKAKMKNKFK